MKIKLILVSKTSENYILNGMAEYCKRLGKYISFNIHEINTGKSSAKMPVPDIKAKEAAMILQALEKEDYLVLLDEKGYEPDSLGLADWLNSKMIKGIKNLVFCVGGAYGFHETVYKRAQEKISLSKMTFSHQLIRIIFLEQLYRAFTIIKGEPYHNA